MALSARIGNRMSLAAGRSFGFSQTADDIASATDIVSGPAVSICRETLVVGFRQFPCAVALTQKL
jgi:hypothetical protein